MSKLMLQQCTVDINERKTLPKILQQAASCTKSDPFKLTRGETMPLVRVYAPVKSSRNDKNKENSNKGPEMPNITIDDDNTLGLRTEQIPLENNVIHVTEEKDDYTINGNEHNDVQKGKYQDKDDNTVAESAHTENSNDSTVNETDNLEQVTVGKDIVSSKDGSKIMEGLNKFLDIKPDIVRVKEENLSDDETAQENLTDTDIKKIVQASSTFAEQITDNSEHSKVFQVCKNILESETTILKKEIKNEPEDDSDSETDESFTGDSSERSLPNLETEVNLKAGNRKRKIYRCTKCDFSGFHREYKDHVKSCCRARVPINIDTYYKCTKCNKSFVFFKRYSLHFEKHGYPYMACPQCRIEYGSARKLLAHLNCHIKNQFEKVKLMSNTKKRKSKGFQFQCKTCKEFVATDNSFKNFKHWERHLQLKEVDKEPPTEPYEIGLNGEHALKAEKLKEVLASLLTEEKSNTPESKRIKVCVVCARRFERRNGCKRHLIEHLLKDAYAKFAVNNHMLTCQICSEPQQKPDCYRKHMRDHASLPIYQCGICDKTLSDSSNFTKHKKRHNLMALVCDICNKKFQAEDRLEKHMEMHKQTGPIPCDRCDKVFYCQSYYKLHVRKKHDKVALKCQLCREKFATLKDKWDHMWLVHKQRKHIADCPVCGSSYRRIFDLKKHMRNNHGWPKYADQLTYKRQKVDQSRNVAIGGNVAIEGNVATGGNSAIGRNVAIGRNMAIGGNSAIGRNVAIGRNMAIGGNSAKIDVTDQDSDYEYLLIEEETLLVYD